MHLKAHLFFPHHDPPCPLPTPSLTLGTIGVGIQRGEGGRNPPPSSENRNVSATKHPVDPKPVCKVEFVSCGPVEKKERSICFGLIVAA